MKVQCIVPLDKKKSLVVLEGGETFPLYQGEIRRYGILEGGELETHTYHMIMEEVLKKRVKERALYLLKSMDRTEKDIRVKLNQGHYPEKLIDYALAFLKTYGYVDDQRYVENYIQTYLGRKSRKMIEQQLILKGIDRNLLRTVWEEMDSQDSDERSLIYKLLAKKKYVYGETDRKEKNKVMGFLLRKGFQMEDITFCMNHLPEDMEY